MSQNLVPADERVQRPLWRNLSFVLMWSSVAASGFSDRIIQLAALPMLGVDAEQAQAAAITAGITFWFFVPYLVITPLAGWLADHLPRKWIMLACDETRGGILLLGAALVAYQMPSEGASAAIPPSYHWQVYGIIALIGTMAAVFLPARNAVIPQIVPFAQLQRANALTFGIAVIASLVGFVIGGWILAETSVARGLMVGALCYLVSGLFFAFIKPEGERRPTRDGARSLRYAVRYVREHRRVIELVVVGALIWAVANLLFAAVAALVKQRFGFVEANEFVVRFSQISAVAGIGMLVSAIVIGWMNFRRESQWVLALSLGLSGVSALGLAASPSFGVAMAFMFLAGFFGNAAMVCTGTLLQTISPNYIRGRVFALESVVSTLSAVAINFAIWQLPGADDWMVPALVTVGVVLLVVGVIYNVRELRRGPLNTGLRNTLWRLNRWYALVWHRLVWVGRHNVPATGPVILASNHTTGVDPLLMQAACRRVVRWVMLTSYQVKILDWLWRALRPIALDRSARDVGKLRQIIGALNDGDVVGLFPEGGLQRENRELKPFQPGIVMIAQRSGAPIVPVWISGTPRRKHMLMHFLQPSSSTVSFGKPFFASPDADHQEVLNELRQRMLALSNGNKGDEDATSGHIVHGPVG